MRGQYIEGNGSEQLKADFLEKRLNAVYRKDNHLTRFAKAMDCYEDVFETGGACYGSEISRMFPEAWVMLDCYNNRDGSRANNPNIDWKAVTEICDAKMDTIISDVFSKHTKKLSLTRANGYYELVR